jgi:hypothetical protein
MKLTGRKVFFFEKTEQKLLSVALRGVITVSHRCPGEQTKVFCFFFSKKKTFFCSIS